MRILLQSSSASNTNGPNPAGYRREFIIKPALDGTITFARQQPNEDTPVPYTAPILTLGNKGDKNITYVTFDLSNLTESFLDDNNLADYAVNLLIYNPDSAQTEQLQIYTITYDTIYLRWYWVVPDNVFETSRTSRCILTITEANTSIAHTYSADTEVWVSHEFQININDTLWHVYNQAISLIEYDYNDVYGYLMKPSIVLTPSIDYYSLSASNQDLGTKKDAYVKHIELQEPLIDDELDKRYGIFVPTTGSAITVYQVEFEKRANLSIYSCLVPKEVTFNSGNVEFFVIATNEAEDKRWVSNTLEFSITDNFLDMAENIHSRLDWNHLAPTEDYPFTLA